MPHHVDVHLNTGHHSLSSSSGDPDLGWQPPSDDVRLGVRPGVGVGDGHVIHGLQHLPVQQALLITSIIVKKVTFSVYLCNVYKPCRPRVEDMLVLRLVSLLCILITPTQRPRNSPINVLSNSEVA